MTRPNSAPVDALTRQVQQLATEGVQQLLPLTHLVPGSDREGRGLDAALALFPRTLPVGTTVEAPPVAPVFKSADQLADFLDALAAFLAKSPLAQGFPKVAPTLHALSGRVRSGSEEVIEKEMVAGEWLIRLTYLHYGLSNFALQLRLLGAQVGLLEAAKTPTEGLKKAQALGQKAVEAFAAALKGVRLGDTADALALRGEVDRLSQELGKVSGALAVSWF